MQTTTRTPRPHYVTTAPNPHLKPKTRTTYRLDVQAELTRLRKDIERLQEWTLLPQ